MVPVDVAFFLGQPAIIIIILIIIIIRIIIIINAWLHVQTTGLAWNTCYPTHGGRRSACAEVVAQVPGKEVEAREHDHLEPSAFGPCQWGTQKTNPGESTTFGAGSDIQCPQPRIVTWTRTAH